MEHDEDTMLAADYIVDIGPGAGAHGGQVVACGTAEEIMKNKKFCDRCLSERQNQNTGSHRAQKADRFPDCQRCKGE